MRSLSAFLAGGSDDQDLHLDENSSLGVVSGAESLRQRVVETLRLFRGELFLDARRGIDYFNEVFQRPVHPGLAASLITSAILERNTEVTGVRNIELTLSPQDRSGTFRVVVDSIYGSMDLEGEIGAG